MERLRYHLLELLLLRRANKLRFMIGFLEQSASEFMSRSLV